MICTYIVVKDETLPKVLMLFIHFTENKTIKPIRIKGLLTAREYEKTNTGERDSNKNTVIRKQNIMINIAFEILKIKDDCKIRCRKNIPKARIVDRLTVCIELTLTSRHFINTAMNTCRQSSSELKCIMPS